MTDDIILRSYNIKDPSPLPEDTVSAMAYVPFQEFGDIYEDLKALECGTLFPVLNKPFTGKRGDLR